MKTVVYENENALFEFSIDDVKECLNFCVSEYKVDKAAQILDLLKRSEGKRIKIPEEKSYFGFIVLDLLSKNKGTALCKICQKAYRPDQLKLIPIGHGKSPFHTPKLLQQSWICKRIFRRRRRNPAMHGGKGYQCPEGHELIAMITWRT